MSFFLSAGTLIALTSLNYIIDPYLIHQWDSILIQRLRPTREKLSPWGKTYAVAKYKPEVMFLGNSRTELGLPTQLELFSGKKVFNGALSGGSLGDAIAMSKHGAAISHLDTVVWGIDYPSFFLDIGNTDFDRELVADNESYSFRRALLNIKRAVAIDMAEDSVKVLLGSFGEVCRSSLAFYGQRDEACMEAILQNGGDRIKVWESDIRKFIQANPSAQFAVGGLDLAVGKLCSADIKIRLYINPTHALTFYALFQSGKWDAMNAWLHALVKMVDLQRQSGCDIRLFDFSGFNSITTEKIPTAIDQEQMKNYWDTSHYRSHVGSMILKRIFFNNDDSVPYDFGIELNSDILSGHLRQMRLNLDRFHHSRPVEIQLIKNLMSGGPPGNTQ